MHRMSIELFDYLNVEFFTALMYTFISNAKTLKFGITDHEKLTVSRLFTAFLPSTLTVKY